MSTAEFGLTPLSSATRPTGRWEVFGRPPLLGDEKQADYDEMYDGISDAVKPADFLERIWVCDIADLTWEIFRFRGYKADLIEKSATIKRFDDGSGERDVDRFNAQTLSQDLDHIEQFERITAMMEARRNNALREIERRRATFADALRRHVRQIENDECHVVDEKTVEESDRA